MIVYGSQCVVEGYEFSQSADLFSSTHTKKKEREGFLERQLRSFVLIWQP